MLPFALEQWLSMLLQRNLHTEDFPVVTRQGSGL